MGPWSGPGVGQPQAEVFQDPADHLHVVNHGYDPHFLLASGAGHGGQSFQGVVGFLLFAILGAVEDRGLFGRAVHAFWGEGRPNQIGGQILQGFPLAGLDAPAGKDVEAGVPPTIEDADEFGSALLLAQEHGEHLHAEELLQGLQVELRSDPEQALPVSGCTTGRTFSPYN
jgi:hypothetical protein